MTDAHKWEKVSAGHYKRLVAPSDVIEIKKAERHNGVRWFAYLNRVPVDRLFSGGCLTLEDAKRDAERVKRCVDCGRIHPHLTQEDRCRRCYEAHEALKKSYRAGLNAATWVEHWWAIVELVRAAPSTEAALVVLRTPRVVST